MRLALAALSLAFLPVVPAQAAVCDVTVASFQFSPDALTVAPGTTVHWCWTGDNHTVTSDTPGQFDSGVMSTGGTYARAFPSPGSFAYHCTIHSSMTATITVTGGTPTHTTPPPVHTTKPAPKPTTNPPATTTQPRATTTTTQPASPTATPTPTPTPTATPSGTPAPVVTTVPTTSTSPLADGSGGGGSGTTVALVVFAALVVAGGAALLAVRLRGTT